jgi:hypothetical protein
MSLGSALRQAVTDFYFNSWRLAPANLVWGVGFIALLVAGPLTVVGVAILVVLAVPLAGLHRMAALIARDEPVAFSDFVAGMRRYAGPAIAAAAGAAILAAVFTTNVVVGLGAGGPFGWFISALALWGDVALVMLLGVFWPVLVDPRREGLGLRRRFALAGLVVIGRPGRVAALTIVVAAILIVSTVLFAAILLVSVAYVALVSARYVLPMLDALEARMPEGRLPG